jgi:hypothetical protein
MTGEGHWIKIDFKDKLVDVTGYALGAVPPKGSAKRIAALEPFLLEGSLEDDGNWRPIHEQKNPQWEGGNMLKSPVDSVGLVRYIRLRTEPPRGRPESRLMIGRFELFGRINGIPFENPAGHL